MRTILILLCSLMVCGGQSERRTAQQKVALLQGGGGGSDLLAGITLRAKLDDGSGTTAADSSGNGYNGTVTQTDGSAFGVGQ